MATEQYEISPAKAAVPGKTTWTQQGYKNIGSGELVNSLWKLVGGYPVSLDAANYRANMVSNTSGGSPATAAVYGTREVEDPYTSQENTAVAVQMPAYNRIATPSFQTTLDAASISRLSEEAKNYAALAFAPGYAQLDQNLVNAARRATEEEASVKPQYEQGMRDSIAMGSVAAVNAMQGANQLGRLRGGQPGEIYGNLKQAGMEGAVDLEGQLGQRVSDIYNEKTQAGVDIDALRLSMKKEEGLTEQVQKATMVKEELQRNISIKQMEFENALASSADYQNWQQINLAYQSFQQQSEQALWERGITERQLAAELESTSLSNQLALKQLSGGYGSSEPGLNAIQTSNRELSLMEIAIRQAELDEKIRAGSVSTPKTQEELFMEEEFARERQKANIENWKGGGLGRY